MNCVFHWLQLEHKRADEKAERDRLNDLYLELVEKQRAYYKKVKDFQDVRTPSSPMIGLVSSTCRSVFFFFFVQECRKNEVLLSKLKAKGVRV